MRWDADIQAVYSVVDGHLEDDKYMLLMEYVLELAAQKNATRWLDNALKSRAVSPAMQEWTLKVWDPLADKIGFLKTAIISPESTLTRLSVERLLNRNNPKIHTETRFFKNIEDARAWLKD